MASVNTLLVMNAFFSITRGEITTAQEVATLISKNDFNY